MIGSLKEGLFRKKVYGIVASIPRGKVATYGQIALFAGIPRATREVGWIAHHGPSNLPWQRVVNRFGGLAKGYPGGQLGHKIDLESKDGLKAREDMTIDLAKHQWRPDSKGIKSLALPAKVTEELGEKISFSRKKLSYRGRRS